MICFVCLCKCIFVCMFIWVCVCVFMYLFLCKCVYFSVFIFMFVFACFFECLSVFMCIAFWVAGCIFPLCMYGMYVCVYFCEALIRVYHYQKVCLLWEKERMCVHVCFFCVHVLNVCVFMFWEREIERENACVCVCVPMYLCACVFTPWYQDNLTQRMLRKDIERCWILKKVINLVKYFLGMGLEVGGDKSCFLRTGGWT